VLSSSSVIDGVRRAHVDSLTRISTSQDSPSAAGARTAGDPAKSIELTAREFDAHSPLL